MVIKVKTNNPRNRDSALFRLLTRLFSGPIVNYRAQAPRRNKRRNLDKYNFTSASGQNFKKSQYSPYESLQIEQMATMSRLDRYVDFDQMEYTPEVASAMDIYADEMTTSNIIRPLLKVRCPNEEIKSVLETLYYDIMNIQFNLFGWCRTMCKYGDFYLYLDIDEKTGIKNVIGLPTAEVERLEGEDKQNPNYVQYQWNSGGMTFENWQIAHFRVLGNDKFAPYGTSVLDPARRIWRQLILLEDAMMAYRIVRSPERRVFYIDVGNIPPQDVEQYMQKVMTQMKRNQLVDATSGRVDLRYNPMSTEEDYFIPVRGDTKSTVESLPGGTYTGDIEDVKYLRDKLFSALKIPGSYLSNTEGDEDKTTLAQKDIRFARTIQRLQRAAISELEKIGIIHLFTLGYRGADLISFELQLNNPSKIAELQELEQWRTRFDVANGATDGYFSKRWVSENLFHLSEEDFVRMQREMFFDKSFEAQLEQVAQETADAGGGLDMGDPGGLFGDEDVDLDIGDEALEGEEPEEEPADEFLLAAPDDEGTPPPANRDPEETPAAKGKVHIPTNVDRRKGMGPRRRQMHAQGGSRSSGGAPTAKFPGFKDLERLGRGLSENVESTYDRQEEDILKTNQEVKQLIESLEINEGPKVL